MAKRTKDIEKKLIGFTTIVLVIGIVTGYGLHSLSSSYAAAKPKAGSGSCYASPNPTPLRSTFTVYMSGMPPNTGLGVYTSDVAGTGWVSTMSDASGNATVSDPYTAYQGTSTITVKASARKSTVVATCNVTVQ